MRRVLQSLCGSWAVVYAEGVLVAGHPESIGVYVSVYSRAGYMFFRPAMSVLCLSGE